VERNRKLRKRKSVHHQRGRKEGLGTWEVVVGCYGVACAGWKEKSLSCDWHLELLLPEINYKI